MPEKLACDAILVATGRVPNTELLNLDKIERIDDQGSLQESTINFEQILLMSLL